VVAFVEVRVAVEHDVDPVLAEELFEMTVAVQERIGSLARAVGVEGEMEERERERSRVRREVVLEPLVLGT